MIVNVNGLSSKKAALQSAVDYIKPDVIMGCESKIDTAQVVNAIYGVFRNGYFFSICTLMNLSNCLIITIDIMDMIV